MSGMAIYRQLFHLHEVENALAIRNDASNGVLPGLLPYGGKQLCGVVTSSPSRETRRIHSESFLSCNLRSSKVNFDIAREAFSYGYIFGGSHALQYFTSTSTLP
jgi:hypothetical protein